MPGVFIALICLLILYVFVVDFVKYDSSQSICVFCVHKERNKRVLTLYETHSVLTLIQYPRLH